MADETVQVAKSELDALRSIRAMMDKAWKNEKTGSNFRKMLKADNPEISIPEDVADAVAAPLIAKVDEVTTENKALAERLTKWETDQKNREDETTLRAELDRIKTKFNFDDEGMAKVVARMKEKHNPDVESAAAFVASQIPKAKPIVDPGIVPQPANLFGAAQKEADLELLHKGNPFGPGGFFETEAMKVLNESAEQQAA